MRYRRGSRLARSRPRSQGQGPENRSRNAGDPGSAALEAALLAPAFIALMLLVVFAGRIVNRNNEVQTAAAAAARAASQQATPVGAAAEAEQVAQVSLNDAGVSCNPSDVEVDAQNLAPGGSVTVTVRCTTQLGDMALIGVPGSHTIEASATEVVDTYRGSG